MLAANTKGLFTAAAFAAVPLMRKFNYSHMTSSKISGTANNRNAQVLKCWMSRDDVRRDSIGFSIGRLWNRTPRRCLTKEVNTEQWSMLGFWQWPGVTTGLYRTLYIPGYEMQYWSPKVVSQRPEIYMQRPIWSQGVAPSISSPNLKPNTTLSRSSFEAKGRRQEFFCLVALSLYIWIGRCENSWRYSEMRLKCGYRMIGVLVWMKEGGGRHQFRIKALARCWCSRKSHSI